jgi:hypothetical protein
MSKMSDLNMEIQEYLMNGVPPENVAKTLNVPLRWVTDTLDYMLGSDEPDMEYGEEL